MKTWIKDLLERSKNDQQSRMIVGSEVRQLIGEIEKLAGLLERVTTECVTDAGSDDPVAIPPEFSLLGEINEALHKE